MKAAVFIGEGNLQVTNVPMPSIINSNDVLIKVEGCAICGSDVSVVSVPRRHPATPGTIIGHEYMGTIVETGKSVQNFTVGERVVVEPNIACRNCYMCKTGHQNMCINMKLTGFHYNGGMAEYSVMPQSQLHKILNQNIDYELAVLAEPLACIVNSLNKFSVLPGDYCVVIGAGPIGLMYIETLLASGAAKIIVSECIDIRRIAALQKGAMVIDPRETNLVKFVKSETNGQGADIVIDCVGGLMSDAIQCCAPGGKVVLFGLDQEATNMIVPFDISCKEINVIGSYVVNNSFPRAIR
jgi:threonine dehydrogenase-like Zn-dependent dehydrogenase